MNKREKIKSIEAMISIAADDKPNIFPLAPCPWCLQTPSFSTNYFGKSGGTWIWRVFCGNRYCLVKPQGQPIPIRKSQRFSVIDQLEKLRRIQYQWNAGAPYSPREEVLIKNTDLLEQIKLFLRDEYEIGN